MEHTLAREEGYVQELTEKQSWKLFDRVVHYYPGVSGEEFVARWESGQYKGPDAEPGRMSVVMLLPFARSREARRRVLAARTEHEAIRRSRESPCTGRPPAS